MAATDMKGVPKCFRPLANMAGFTFFICIYAFFSGFFSLYTVSQLTSIAKQFNMATDRAGFLVSSSEFGFMVATVLTGHFLSRSHRPRILFAMGCINGLACIVASIPYFVDRAYDPSALNFQSNDSGVCDAQRVVEQCQFTTDAERERVGELAFGIFLVATILAGFAASGVWTIGVTYVDDNCDPKKSPFYLGIIFFVRFLSPVGALLSGAGFSAIPLHLEDNGLTPEDMSWVAAWWLGYITIGIANIIVGIPLIFFPKNLRRTDDAPAVKSGVDDVSKTGDVVQNELKSTEQLHHATDDESPSFMELLKDFPRVIARLLCNPIVLFISIGLAIEFSVAVAYPTFVPLYLEVYFKVTAYTANIITGVSAAAAVALGVLVSGWVLSKVRTSLNRMAAFAAVSDFTATLLFLVMLAINCDNAPMAGVNTPGEHNLTQPCNLACSCDNSFFNPVCGSDGITYNSPCHAGCQDVSGDGPVTLALNYPNCTCIDSGAGFAVPGPCGTTCDGTVMVYGVVLFVLSCVLSGAAMPIYMILLRCTEVGDKSMAIALMNVMSSAGIIPLPVIFGIFIETACLMYPSACGGGGYCLFYDNQQLRFVLHIITFGGRLLPPVFYALGLFCARKIVFAGDAQMKDLDETDNRNGEKSDDELGVDNMAANYGESHETYL